MACPQGLDYPHDMPVSYAALLRLVFAIARLAL